MASSGAQICWAWVSFDLVDDVVGVVTGGVVLLVVVVLGKLVVGEAVLLV